MATEIRIHRGDQIGGCITEIWTKKTRILIDFGEELPGNKNSEPFQMDWEAGKRKKKPGVSAVLFTHYHGDHVGRFAEAPEGIRLYLSPLAREVLENIHDALWNRSRKLFHRDGREADQKEMEREENILKVLRNQGRACIFEPGEGRMMQPVKVGDITVTPCRVDHSASEACMFLVETPERRILHTGDFRGHGLQGQGGAAVLDDVRQFAARKIDTLIIEGTMMSRRDGAPYSEEDLRNTADRLFQDHKHVFLLVSSTNLDSIITFYQAAKAQGIPMYCHSSYVAAQLRTLGRYAREYLGIEGLEHVIKFSDVPDVERRKGFVTLINAYCYGLVEQFKDCQPVVIYSMWEGYVTRQPGQGRNEAYYKFVRICQDVGISVIPPMDGTPSPYPPMHTSGHASPELIAKVIREANPSEIRPIHTENVGGFFELDIQEMKRRININGYRWVKDHRAISPRALAKFLGEKDGVRRGSHRAFVELVKDNRPDELAFCFRGNSGDRAAIYYRNHIVFRILSRGKIEFDFGHARYMEEAEWLKVKKKLYDFGYEFEEGQKAGIVSVPAEKAEAKTLEELEALYDCIKPMIDSFSKKKGLTEKGVQHQLFLDPSFKQLKDGYFFYDLEFSQPHAKDLGCENQPDMLAVRFDAYGKPTRLVFAEVKATLKALDGKSGLSAHIRGMERYPDWLLPVRSQDACSILNQYRELGLIKARCGRFEERDFIELPREILLIFTGHDTLAALDERKRNNRALLKDYALVTDEFSQLSAIGPIEVYRRDF